MVTDQLYQPDEDYLPQATACGVGACARTGETSCVAGQIQDSCVPGEPGLGSLQGDPRQAEEVVRTWAWSAP